jgi:hypothetical protein
VKIYSPVYSSRVGSWFVGAIVDHTARPLTEDEVKETCERLNSDGLPRTPIPMFLTCPACNARHVDVGEFATKPHHTHSCQGCGLTWRPAIEPTVGVQFLPGFKDAK